MSAQFHAFGEFLWDCLPSGRHAGGAPFNVTAHIAQLGSSSALISAVGEDPLGDEILKVAEDKRVGTEFVARARAGLATGTVLVTLDANCNATYDLVQPAAWDEISVPDAAIEAVANSRAFIFGSLAGRSAYNLQGLRRLLATSGPVKFFDVNLRPPFADPALVIELARHAQVLKLNDDEIGRLAAWLGTGRMEAERPATTEALFTACRALADATGAQRICVTRGSAGAALWDKGNLICAPAPQVIVRDTVGAGDAFMAGLVIGIASGVDTGETLDGACQLGAYVASQYGATPLLPPELIERLKAPQPEAPQPEAP